MQTVMQPFEDMPLLATQSTTVKSKTLSEEVESLYRHVFLNLPNQFTSGQFLKKVNGIIDKQPEKELIKPYLTERCFQILRRLGATNRGPKGRLWTKPTPVKVSAEKIEDASLKKEAECIEFLKSKGYRILKRVEEFQEV